jgi:hypothetical protein
LYHILHQQQLYHQCHFSKFNEKIQNISSLFVLL